MAIFLSKTNAAPYDAISTGDGTNPLTLSVTLDQSGGTVAVAATAYLVADGQAYSSVTVAPQNDSESLDWQVSTDGTTWVESLTLSDVAADSVTTVYFRVVAKNDGTLSGGTYTDVKIDVTGTPVDDATTVDGGAADTAAYVDTVDGGGADATGTDILDGGSA